VTPIRSSALALLAVAALAAAGCGGDDEKASDTTPPASAPTAESTPAPTATTEATDTGAQAPARTSPEDQPGGAGDEEPARVEAALTGRDGKIGPRQVRVPPYIAVEVTLHSADGGDYSVTVKGKRLSVGSGNPSGSLSLSGLRPNASYLVKASDGRTIKVVASAEPGP
jgi:hypothetical protein